MQDFESELVLDAGENRLMIQCSKVIGVRFYMKYGRVAAHGVAAEHTRQTAIIAVLVELRGRQDAEEASFFEVEHHVRGPFRTLTKTSHAAPQLS